MLVCVPIVSLNILIISACEKACCAVVGAQALTRKLRSFPRVTCAIPRNLGAIPTMNLGHGSPQEDCNLSLDGHQGYPVYLQESPE